MKKATRRASRVGRLSAYLAIIFPPAGMLVAATVSFFAVYFALEAIAYPRVLTYTWRALGAIVSCFLMSLLLRIYDELKDADTDLRLAAAGDPKYMERPIPMGLVDVDDLRALRWATSGLALLVNLALGPVVLAAFAGLYAVMWASFHWFFWPKMRDHLLIAFATHNPLTLLLQTYCAIVFAEDFGWSALRPWPAIVLLLGQQGFAAAWEIARKTRAPSDETDYVTYSRALGWKVAPLLPAAFITASATSLVWIGQLAGVSGVYAASVIAAALVTVLACLRYRVSPTTKNANFRPFIEAFAVVGNLGLAIALVVRWGLTVTPIK